MKVQWYVFPITENGITKNYMTDAPIQIITDAFQQSENVNEFIQIVESKNYEVGKHFPSVALNFDE
ncbi:hypothetical protein Kirov_271 [Bacillus phage Kirov]|uniref:Uncharacterized protein n=1 Tax=Bacillus phage Kirov TaxID=2783539 RepID=A0A7U3RZ42_9CAUD|nr:hypothetical protein PQE67_gp033 [Bacillus phage Kirov]QOV08470.1 hypothetical protein Kirov_271 [Bacillus phage Kirov]